MRIVRKTPWECLEVEAISDSRYADLEAETRQKLCEKLGLVLLGQ